MKFLGIDQALGAFEAACGAGVLPAEQAAFLAAPDGDGSAGGARELYRALPGRDLLPA